MNSNSLAAIVSIALIVLAAVVGVLASLGARSRTAAGRSTAVASEGELIAVIAAAVAAASGLEPGSFRIAGIRSSVSPRGAAGGRAGFNTPVWGHIDRQYRGD